MIPLKDTLEWRVVPAVEGRCLWHVKRLIDAVVIEFFLPGCELVSPLQAFL